MPRSASLYPLRTVSPEQVFARVAAEPCPAWLDSSLQRVTDGRFSVMACNPAWVFSAKDDRWDVAHRTGERHHGIGALPELERLLSGARTDPVDGPTAPPFQTGAIGWFSYDLARQIENLPALTRENVSVPDVWFAWYDEALVWDHAADELWLVSTNSDSSSAMRTILYRAESDPPLPAIRPPGATSRVFAESDFTRTDYERAVDITRAGIARGEYYQLNLVQQFQCPSPEPAAQIYRRLRAFNPAPFSAYLQTPDFAVLSTSPERFIHVSPAGEIQTCPIKGTRRRAADPATDRRNSEELLASSKERAELLMIVDLLRNDLGRVCAPGSIAVRRLHALESFATVHHLVGEVRGQLRPDTTREQLIRAVFPGGSITGAPKISAMNAIEHLERHRRGIAMGSIGYFSAHGALDFNIAIRTAVIREGIAQLAVGAGIVWDSEPAAEYAETLAKAEALFSAFGVRPPVA